MATFKQALGGAVSSESLTEIDRLLEQAKLGDGVETVTSGALSLVTALSKVSVTGTQAYTLADGSFVGQRKDIRVTVAASTPVGTLTPDNFADGTSINLDAVGEEATLEWQSDGWHVVRLSGAVVS